MVLIIVHALVLIVSVRLKECDLVVEILFKKQLTGVHHMAVQVLLRLISVSVIWHMYLHDQTVLVSNDNSIEVKITNLT